MEQVLNAIERFEKSAVFTVVCVVGMLLFGTINTLATKFQDLVIAKGLGDAPPRLFNHPFFQTACMFLGEGLFGAFYVLKKVIPPLKKSQPQQKGVLIKPENAKPKAKDPNVFYIEDGRSLDEFLAERKKKRFANPIIFAIPAFLDFSASVLMYFGLSMTQASVYQMLRGTSVVIVGILSMIFLKKLLLFHHWIGIVSLVTGSFIVGLSSMLQKGDASAKDPMFGNLLVLVAQLFNGFQYIFEEAFFRQLTIQPMEILFFEGLFGLLITTVFLFVAYWIPGSDYGSFESIPAAIFQIIYNIPHGGFLIGSVLLHICSIAFFNFFSLQITKRLSSASRSTINACRTIFIWMFGICVGWESFSWPRVLGFAGLVFGTFLFNEVIIVPYYSAWFNVVRKKVKKGQDAKKYEKMVKQGYGLQGARISADEGKTGENLGENASFVEYGDEIDDTTPLNPKGLKTNVAEHEEEL